MTMKKTMILRALLATTLLAAFATTGWAETLTRAHVPFAFEVNGQQLPAGDYLVRTTASNNMVTLLEREGRQVSLLAIPIGFSKETQGNRLVFYFNGVSYRLAEVWNTAAALKVPARKGSVNFTARNENLKRIEIALFR